MKTTKRKPENSGYTLQNNYTIEFNPEEDLHEPPPEEAPEDFSFFYDGEWHDTPAVFSNMSVNEFLSRLEEVEFA
jgi:hypothetical protein